LSRVEAWEGGDGGGGSFSTKGVISVVFFFWFLRLFGGWSWLD
jgi:hypothetical protein